MKKLSLAVAVIVLSLLAHAEDIYLRNGAVIKNVQFIGYREKFKDQHAFFLYNGKESSLMSEVILRIDPVPFDSTLPSTRGRYDSLQNTQQLSNFPKTAPDSLRDLYLKMNTKYDFLKKQYPNLIWLSVTGLSMLTAWEYLSAASLIQAQIDFYDKFNKITTVEYRYDVSKLESAKTRATIIGIAGVAATLITGAYALEPIEIKSDGQSITMAYSF